MILWPERFMSENCFGFLFCRHQESLMNTWLPIPGMWLSHPRHSLGALSREQRQQDGSRSGALLGFCVLL